MAARPYWGAHNRVKAARGSASLYGCPCGQPAAQWALVGYGPWLSDPAMGRKGFTYSDNVWDYEALCVPCHKQHDRPTHCLNGHPYDYTRPDTGGKQCRTCLNDAARARYAAYPPERRRLLARSRTKP